MLSFPPEYNHRAALGSGLWVLCLNTMIVAETSFSFRMRQPICISKIQRQSLNYYWNYYGLSICLHVGLFCGNWQNKCLCFGINVLSSRWLELSCTECKYLVGKGKPKRCKKKNPKKREEGENWQPYCVRAVPLLKSFNELWGIQKMINRHSPPISRQWESHLSEVPLISQRSDVIDIRLIIGC